MQDLHVADKMPAYVQPKTFSLAPLDLLVPSDLGASRTVASVRHAVGSLPVDWSTRKTLSILLDQAGDSLTTLEQSVEAQFNGAMDRVSGWYKQRTQVIVLTIAALPLDRYQRRYLRDRHRPRQQLCPARGRHRRSQDLYGNREAFRRGARQSTVRQ